MDNGEHPENPSLGLDYPHVTHWRCDPCHANWTIADAKEREWCSLCGQPLRLLDKPIEATLRGEVT